MSIELKREIDQLRRELDALRRDTPVVPFRVPLTTNAAESVPLSAFVLQEGGVYAEHIRCKSRAEPGEDVAILKEELIRQTIIGQTFLRRGVPYAIRISGESTSFQQVECVPTGDPTTAEIWNVIPSWETNDIIWAAPIAEDDQQEIGSSLSNDPRAPASGALTPKWIEVRGRYWAAQRINDVIG